MTDRETRVFKLDDKNGIPRIRYFLYYFLVEYIILTGVISCTYTAVGLTIQSSINNEHKNSFI